MSNKVEYVKDTFEDFSSKKEYVSASDIETFLKSPRDYFYSKNKTEEREEKRHFAVGLALYQYILERKLFNENFIVSPKFDRRTIKGKEEYALFVEKSNGKKIIFEDEVEMIKKMSVSVQNNRTFMELLEGSQYEISCYAVDKKTGIKVKLRPDILPMNTNTNTIVNIRSCLDSSPNKFKNDVNTYGYFVSAAYYLDFLSRNNYVFAAIEKNPPYQSSLYMLSEEMLQFGRSEYRMALDLLKWSIENNFWCDYIEFEILKEYYLLGDLSNVIEKIETSQLIFTLR